MHEERRIARDAVVVGDLALPAPGLGVDPHREDVPEVLLHRRRAEELTLELPAVATVSTAI